jgi:hypothetical protein
MRPKKEPPAIAIGPVRIHPLDVYTLPQLRQALGLTKTTIAREIQLKRLRVTRRAGRYFFLGSWVSQWLREGELGTKKRAVANEPPE